MHACVVCTRVETGSGHPGHVLSGSSRSDPVYKISRFDHDSAVDHMYVHVLIVMPGPDQSNELSVHDDVDGSVSSTSQNIWRDCWYN